MGNQFEVRVSNPLRNDISEFITEIGNIPNYYGLQRFGSERLVTHLVGRAIINENFKKAVEIFLCHTTEYDTQFSKEIREKCNDPNNYVQGYKNYSERDGSRAESVAIAFRWKRIQKCVKINSNKYKEIIRSCIPGVFI
jgi:TruD family tRNA pseudouridine synthase